MVEQLGFAIIPLCFITAPGLTSGTTNGTSGFILNAELLSITTAEEHTSELQSLAYLVSDSCLAPVSSSPCIPLRLCPPQILSSCPPSCAGRLCSRPVLRSHCP